MSKAEETYTPYSGETMAQTDGMNGCLDYEGCEKVYAAMIAAALTARQSK